MALRLVWLMFLSVRIMWDSESDVATRDSSRTAATGFALTRVGGVRRDTGMLATMDLGPAYVNARLLMYVGTDSRERCSRNGKGISDRRGENSGVPRVRRTAPVATVSGDDGTHEGTDMEVDICRKAYATSRPTGGGARRHAGDSAAKEHVDTAAGEADAGAR